MYAYFNNDFYQENDISFGFNNRSFRYGDGLFETIRVFDGEIPFLGFHFARLQKGLDILDLKLNKNFEDLEAILLTLLAKNELKNGRLRLMVFRSGKGLYKPETSEAEIFIEVKPLASNQFALNEDGLNLGLFTDVPKIFSTVSILKTNNALPYILAANFACKNGFDECVLLNEKEKIADTIYSNIFVCKEDYIFLPPLADGAVAGTMQAIILELAEKESWKVHFTSLNESDILAADEVFLSNAIRGVQWVKSYKNEEKLKEFDNKWAVHITEKLNILLNQVSL